MESFLGAWKDPIYEQTVITLLIFLFVLGIALYPFRTRNINMKTGWAIFTSWFFAVPVVCLILGLSDPYPLIGFTILSIIATKEFFQMTGVYNRYLFVGLTYFMILAAAACVQLGYIGFLNVTPMLLLGLLCLIPLIKNEFHGMLQNIALSLLAFIFFGWSFLHLAMLAKWQNGIRYIIYIMILTEFFDTVILSWSKLFGKINYIDKIAPRRSLEGLIIGILLTFLLAWGLRHLLPETQEIYWLVSGTIASLVGGLGDITMGVVRRDLGVKDVGAYIFGRGGVIDRLDRLIFVAPMYYYALVLLQQYHH